MQKPAIKPEKTIERLEKNLNLSEIQSALNELVCVPEEDRPEDWRDVCNRYLFLMRKARRRADPLFFQHIIMRSA